MVKVRISRKLKQFIEQAAQSGLFTSEDDVIRVALTRLKRAIPASMLVPAPAGDVARSADLADGELSPLEVDRRLLASGLVIRFPDRSKEIDDEDDPPIEIQREPLSETIIRERR